MYWLKKKKKYNRNIKKLCIVLTVKKNNMIIILNYLTCGIEFHIKWFNLYIYFTMGS